MISPEEKFRLVQQQVTAKIRWGASGQEVAEWLQKKHGLIGEPVEQMLTRAFKARRTALRERAYVRIAFSFGGLALVGALFYVLFIYGVGFYGVYATIAVVCASATGLTSLVVLIRNVAFLLRGDVAGSID
jgi:hypothetical protein